ncbi:MAG: tRNA (adenosine(37)-N6)-threonylcarbamoyltransferase complex transferase subunit TsaD, partial [Polyangiales bacterium]
MGIESSCDESAVALVQGDGRVLAQRIHTQLAEHAPFGGVVPELASRAHIRTLAPLLASLLREVGGWSQVDAIAATQGPGLPGALLVGFQFGKTLAWARGLPFAGVDHLQGHLLAPFVWQGEAAPADRPVFPYIALLVSGGHTALYRVEDALSVTLLGQTRDDAAGEAFDKAGKMLGLPYPGGPVIDRLAPQGVAARVPLPRPMQGRRAQLDFSFSGLKTALWRWREAQGETLSDARIADACAAFQDAVVGALVQQAVAACQQEALPRLVLTGGVAANRQLRQAMGHACRRAGIGLHLTPAVFCTDNAAMIAYAGALRL